MRALPAGADLRWCSTCNARERLHVDGRCVICDSVNPRPAVIRPCAACGRPCTGQWCSESCRSADEGPLTAEDRW